MRELALGLRTVGRSFGLVPLLLAVNLVLAALLAVPLAGSLERDLRNTDAAARMTDGFDYAWWSQWSERQPGYTRHLAPDLLGAGFAAKNTDLLLKGHLPAELFAGLGAPGPKPPDPPSGPALDPLVLGLGLLSMLLQVFLTGGILGVFRAPQGQWTARGLLHGSGFYFGRLVRIALLTLLSAAVVFAAWFPISRFAESQARESVSEGTALAWSFWRYALLIAALLLVHMVSSYAKVILVLEERSSAALAFLSGLAFSVRHLARAASQYLVVAVLGAALLSCWVALDASFEPTGYRTQIAFLLVAQVFISARLALRLTLIAGQVALYRRFAAGPPGPQDPSLPT